MITYIYIALFLPDHKMAALGDGRSTLANQGISRVMEATPPGYYRAYTTRRS